MISQDLLEKLQFSFELGTFIVCLILVMCQQGLLDYYFVHYTNEKSWLWWIAADIIMMAVLIWLVIFAIKHNRSSKKESVDVDADVMYAYAAWAIYSTVLSIKIALIFRLLAAKIDENEPFGLRTLQIILGLSAIVFLCLILSHHYTTPNSPRQNYLNYLSSTVTLDLIDSILFLQLLSDEKVGSEMNENNFLQIAILFFACFNFILPTFALLKLRFGKRFLVRMPLPYEKFYTLIYYITVNVPYFAIRCYCWRKYNYDVSVFVIKNVIMVLLGMREMWLAVLHWKQNKSSFCESLDKNDTVRSMSVMTRYSSASSSRSSVSKISPHV